MRIGSNRWNNGMVLRSTQKVKNAKRDFYDDYETD